MRGIAKASAVITFLAIPVALVFALRDTDHREALELPPDVRAAFRAEMHGHVMNLDDLLTAMARGDYAHAAEVASLRVDFGHRLWEAMADSGADAHRVAAYRDSMTALGPERPPGPERPLVNGPWAEDFRARGQDLRLAARRFAAVAGEIGSDPPPVAATEVNAAFQELVAACQGCHSAYKIAGND